MTAKSSKTELNNNCANLCANSAKNWSDSSKGYITVKIFCIGLNKTGTTTFERIMSDLGYAHFSNKRAQLMSFLDQGSLDKIFSVIDPYDSFDDWPYFAMYKELAEKYPTAKFVLTTRSSPSKWVLSMKKHTLFLKPTISSPQNMTRDFEHEFYGEKTPFGNEKLFLDHYSRHIESVTEYFDEIGRSGDLVQICWEQEEDTSTLVSFLGLDASKASPVPHTNKGTTWNKWRLKGYEQYFANNLEQIRGDLQAKGIDEAPTGLAEMVLGIQNEYKKLS